MSKKKGSPLEEEMLGMASPPPRISDDPPDPPIQVHVSDNTANLPFKYPTNYIRTTKYTLLTFLPMNLLEQLRRMSNLFFLINMIISCIPNVSPILPITTIIPLVVVLFVAAVRDAFEDYARYQSDLRANNAGVKIIRGGTLQDVASKDIVAGTILYIQKNQEIACDTLILSTSIEDGLCYIETANLDGETNLKPKQALPATLNVTDVGSMLRLRGTVTCDAPSENLRKWEGKLEMKHTTAPCDMNNLLLRGCVLRNCDWVYGVALYTGTNTKLFLNLVQKPPKQSRLDTKLNTLIILILIVQQCLIIILCCLSIPFINANGSAFYLDLYLDRTTDFVKLYLTYFILFGLMMPISLFVSMEFCKAAQAKFMEWDVGMRTETKSMVARTSSLNEELSQVQYIFTDKTGTLTENEMRFAKCFVGDRILDELSKPGSIRRLLMSRPTPEVAKEATAFLRILALCNTIVISGGKGKELTYEGSSTDEVALVGAAAANQFKLVHRTSDTMTVDIMGDKHTLKILATLPFTPERKMMTVVLQEKDNTIVQYTKGADSSVIANVNMASPRNRQLVNSSKLALDGFAREGLRTLAFGQRILTPEQFADWQKVWDSACIAMSNRDDRVHEACLALEKNLDFVSCSAIEDRLQDEVAETIKFFLDAKVVVWILTGDKRETAINIAATSQLMDPAVDDVIILDVEEPISVRNQILAAQERVKVNVNAKRRSTVVVDGKTLETGMNKECYPLFRDLGLLVHSAVCCRVTPLQKAKVVAMFQALGSTCLGVGDGANDVSMIQEAKVGIGIIGLEGSQAERASDYAIPKFRHLRRLLCVHGRSSIVRNSMLIQYSFYKNIVYTLCQFFFAFYNGFSGQTIFDSWVIICFNMIFTLLPPLAMGIFDFDLRDHVILNHPLLYHELRDPYALRMSRVTEGLWAILAVAHGVCVFATTVPLMENDGQLSDGRTMGMWAVGTTLMTYLFIVVLMQACVVFLSWTSIHVMSIVFSIIGYIAFLFVYSVAGYIVGLKEFENIPDVVFGDPKLYLHIIVWTIGLCVLEVAILTIRTNYMGTQSQQARAIYAVRGRGLPWMKFTPKETTGSSPLVHTRPGSIAPPPIVTNGSITSSYEIHGEVSL